MAWAGGPRRSALVALDDVERQPGPSRPGADRRLTTEPHDRGAVDPARTPESACGLDARARERLVGKVEGTAGTEQVALCPLGAGLAHHAAAEQKGALAGGHG